MITAKYLYPRNGFKPAEDLVVNEEYEVKDIDMGQSFTYIELKDRDGFYNSVQFEFYEDGNLLDIYKDKRFNQYRKIFH